MNILVTGANGQLGNEMRIVSKDTNDSYTFTDVVKAEGVETTILDITDADAVRRMVKEKDIQCIVNCAAYTNVDKAESDEALCRKLNADAPKILAEAMKEVTVCSYRFPPTMFSAATRTTLHAVKTRKELLLVFTERPSLRERRTSRLWAVTM